MVYENISPIEFVGREKEFGKLKKIIDDIESSKGRMVLLSGEAGIGKTRLVSEIIKEAEKRKFKIISGKCLSESLEPLFPIKEALRNSGLAHLIYATPPYVLSAYLMNEAGLLIAKVEREEERIDSDIFASMLQAVGSFVQDSFSMMGKEGGGLNTLGYGNYRIIIQRHGRISIATVIQGKESEFLVEDMKNLLIEIGDTLDFWDGDTEKVMSYRAKLEYFIKSGKYNGKFLVDDPKIKQENLFDNILLGLKRISQEKPLLIFLDDLQWADPTSLNLIHYIVRNTKNDKIGIIGTYRYEDIIQKYDGKTHQLRTWMQNMSREDLFDEIRLNRFNLEETKRLIEIILKNSELKDEFYDKIYRETEGIPLYLIETIKLMIDEGNIAMEGGKWKIKGNIEELGIPKKIYDVIRRRIDRLKEEDKEILEIASVIGEEFTTDILARVLDMRKIEILKRISNIEKKYMLICSYNRTYKFSHEKIREVLYEDILPELREEYHRIIGESMEELHRENIDEYIEDIGYHYYKARDERAGRYLVLAGNKAMENYANEEAIRFYEGAIEFIGEEEKFEIYKKLGDVYAIIGEYKTSLEYYSKALKMAKNGDEIAKIKVRIGDLHEKKGEYKEAKKYYRDALNSLSEKSMVRAEIYNSISVVEDRRGNYENSIEYAKKAIEIADSDKERERGYHNMGTTYLGMGNYELALKFLNKAIEIGERIEDLRQLSADYNNIGIVYRKMGDIENALKYYKKSLKVVKKIGDIGEMGTIYNNMGVIYYKSGRLDEALKYFNNTLKIKEKIGDYYGACLSLHNIGGIHADKGDTKKALEFFRKSLDISKKIGDKWVTASTYQGISDTYLESEELDKSEEFVYKSMKIAREIGSKDILVDNYINLSYIYTHRGNFEKEIEFGEKALSLAREMNSKMDIMESYQAMGVAYREMGEYDKAFEYLKKALEISENLKMNVEYAKGLYQLGLVYKKKGDGKWVEIMKKALSIFENAGMLLYVNKINRLFGDQENH